MSAFSDYLENELLDHILKGLTYTAPTSVWIALYTAAPSDAGGGTEVTGGSYARFEVDFSTYNFTAASGGATSNNEDWEFPTATGSWGTVSHFGIFDAVSGGNLLFHAALTTPRAVATDETIRFKAGDLDVSLD